MDELYFRGLKSIKEYQEQLNRFNGQENRLGEKIDEIQGRLGQRVDKSQVMQNAQHFCNLAKNRLQNFSPEEKQRFLRFLVHEIRLDSNRRRAKIIGEIPVKKEDLRTLFGSKLQESGALSMASKKRG